MKNIIILILSLLAIGLGSYVIFDKVIDKSVKDQVKQREKNIQEQNDNTEDNIQISSGDIKLKSINIEKYIIDENGVNTKISVTGKIDLEFDENKYAGVTLSGYCLDSNDTKYIITGPSDGRALYHSGMSDLTLSEDLMSSVTYKNGTTKSIREISWKDISLKACKVEKITGFEKESSESQQQQNNDEVSNNTNNTSNISNTVKVTTTEELYDALNDLMEKRDYNEYAKKVIKSFIPDYQKIFTNTEIYNLFSNVNRIVLSPYDPQNPNLSHTSRAYNSAGNIVVNCFEGELDNDNNMQGLKWLLTHEIIHSLGYFPSEYSEGSFEVSINIRNALLEEGLADSIAHAVVNTDHDNKYAIRKQEEFKMYRVNSQYKVDENSEINHSYTISGNVISVFKYIGCYDEIIHSNINSSFKDLKKCMTNKVKNGDIYFNKLFKTMNNIYLYIVYPNEFYSKADLIEQYKYYKSSEYTLLKEFMENNNLNDLLIEYAKLSAEIINNKKDNTYSICDFYKNNVILYSEDGKTYKTDLKCNN